MQQLESSSEPRKARKRASGPKLDLLNFVERKRQNNDVDLDAEIPG
jgi:hypothetical protein